MRTTVAEDNEYYNNFTSLSFHCIPYTFHNSFPSTLKIDSSERRLKPRRMSLFQDFAGG